MSTGDAFWREAAGALGRSEPSLGADASFLDALRRYADEIAAWGRSIHLTGRERASGVFAEQVCDSAAMLRCAEGALQDKGRADALRAADIGTGAGFPGVIWKLARPDWEIVLIERRERIAAFLRRLVVSLGLRGIEVFEGDAREIKPGGFDLVVSKAAGRFPAILPVAWRVGGPNSLYVTAKGKGWEAELSEAPACLYEQALVVPIGADRGVAIALRKKSP